ncbi:MAG: LysR family transcriptional regulator [Candidatus Binataceae bacterium]
MELDIRVLSTFRAVAEQRSFTAAAKRLGLTQSSVSQQISALERSLGAQLLKRSNKFVGLTTAGEIFLQCARQVLDNLDRVRGLLADQTKTASGHLSIGAPALFCHSLFPAVLSAFHLRFPAIALSVVTADPDTMAARLAHRELDLALLPYPVKQRSLGMVQLGRDELVAIVSPQHELARQDRLQAKDLKGQPLIVPNPGNKLWAAWDNFLIEAGVFPEIIVETDDLDLAKRLAIAGHGASVAPRWLVLSEIERGELCAIPLGGEGAFRQWCLAYHHGSELTGMRRSFLKICQEEMPRLLSGPPRSKRPGARDKGPESRALETAEDLRRSRLSQASEPSDATS